MPVIFCAVILILFYLAFHVNVFGAGLLFYDNTSEDVFGSLSARRKARLHRLFDQASRFRYFVHAFNSFVLIVCTLLVFRLTQTAITIHSRPHPVILILALLLTWILSLMIVELIPRRASSRLIIKTLTRKHLLISILYYLFVPAVMLIEKFLSMFTREKISEEKKEDLVERAIETLADSAGIEEPLMEADEREMIENIFELDQTPVKAVMVPRIDIVAINATASLAEIKQIARSSGHSRFPVYGETADDVLGFLYVKDLFCHDFKEQEPFNLLAFIRRAYVIPESKRLDKLLEELKTTRMHIALVVDEYGGTAGIVTMEDIIEVIVGDILDEHDYEHPEIERLEDGSLRVDANVSLEDLAEYLELEVVDSSFETVGGLLYDLAGTLPSVGQVLVHNGLEFTVEEVAGQRIRTVRLRTSDQHHDNIAGG